MLVACAQAHVARAGLRRGLLRPPHTAGRCVARLPLHTHSQNFTGAALDTRIANREQTITPGVVSDALEDLGQEVVVGANGKPMLAPPPAPAAAPASSGSSKRKGVTIAVAVVCGVGGAVLLAAAAMMLLAHRRRTARQLPTGDGGKHEALSLTGHGDADGLTPRSGAGPVAEGVVAEPGSSNGFQTNGRAAGRVRAPVGLRMSDDDSDSH